jgi:hypothetical protein
MELDGKALRITPASFANAMELQTAVAEALKGTKLDLSGLAGAGLDSEIEDLAGPIGTMVSGVLSVITSKRVENALFECCKTALIGDDKITRDFFEDPEKRELYYPIMTEVVKVNLGPFFKRLGSLFGGAEGMLSAFLKLKSTSSS